MRDECDQGHGGVFLAASVPSCAVIVVRRPVSAFRPAVEGRLTAGRALHQRHLVGGGPLLRPVGAGAVAGPLAVVEQVAAVGVLLHAEQLVLGVGEADAQRHAAVGHRDVLLHPDLPGTLDSALVAVKDVEQGGGGQVHGGHSHVVHWRRTETQGGLAYMVTTISSKANHPNTAGVSKFAHFCTKYFGVGKCVKCALTEKDAKMQMTDSSYPRYVGDLVEMVHWH